MSENRSSSITASFNLRSEQLLKQLEWSERFQYIDSYSCCPICRGIKPNQRVKQSLHIGHYSDCPYYKLFED